MHYNNNITATEASTTLRAKIQSCSFEKETVKSFKVEHNIFFQKLFIIMYNPFQLIVVIPSEVRKVDLIDVADSGEVDKEGCVKYHLPISMTFKKGHDLFYLTDLLRSCIQYVCINIYYFFKNQPLIINCI